MLDLVKEPRAAIQAALREMDHPTKKRLNVSIMLGT